LASHRKGNLDLVRAIAIGLVLIHHCIQMSPITTPWLRETAIYGQYGVDLFFVLSGWLIGGLYWRERIKYGDVRIFRFWARRWMRTIPPYLAALVASWLAVYIARREPFDFGYLIFLQNYYQQIPFFLVSWSLCVEEHFYLLVPLVFLLLGNFSYSRRNASLFVAVLIAGPLMRLVVYPYVPHDFGFALTATHLHMSGLVLGMFLSYFAIAAPEDFKSVVRIAPYIVAASAIGLVVLGTQGGGAKYVLWETTIAIFFAGGLLLAVSKAEIGERLAAIVFPIAVTSYSIYLTHPLALHATNELMRRFSLTGPLPYFLLAAALIVISTVSFYFVFERASIEVRDLYWPSRDRDTRGKAIKDQLENAP
jgi:peptidoglycan/LPS O-acetylase OafA/YrhL